MPTTDPSVVVALDTLIHSKARVGETRRLLSETLYRIAASRRRLNPAFALAGSSDNEYQALRASVSARLMSGALFPAGRDVIGGTGRGKACVVCRKTIGGTDLEYEIPLGESVAVFAHLFCYVVWLEESDRQAIHESV